MRPNFTVRGNSYRKKITDPTTGRVISVSAKSPAELMIKVRKIQATFEQARLGLIRPDEARREVVKTQAKHTVEELWGRWLASAGKDTSWGKKAESIWRHHLRDDFAGLAWWEVTDERLAAWEQKKQQQISQATIKNAWDLLKAVYKRGQRDGIVDMLLWEGWKPARPIKREIEAAVSVEELRALIDQARAHDEAAWKRGRYSDLACRVAVMALTGMRQGEAAALGWDCVRIDEKPYFVLIRWQALDQWPSRFPHWERPMSPTKQRREEAVRIGAACVAMLRVQRENLRRLGWYRPDGPVFPAKGGKWRTHALVVKPEQVRELARLAGIPGWERWRTHSLRHSFATLELIASGGDLEAVRRRTRHADVQTLLRYVHPAARAEAPGSFVDVGDIQETPEERRPVLLPDGLGETAAAAPLLVSTSAAEADRGLAAAAEEAARAYVEARKEREAKRREWRRNWKAKGRRKIAPFLDIALGLSDEEFARAATFEWRPREVTEDADRAYAAAYAREMRAHGEHERARKAGVYARRAKLMAWASCMKKAIEIRRRYAEGETWTDRALGLAADRAGVDSVRK